MVGRLACWLLQTLDWANVKCNRCARSRLLCGRGGRGRCEDIPSLCALAGGFCPVPVGLDVDVPPLSSVDTYNICEM